MASIRKRGENSWQVIVSNGYGSAGEKLTKSKSVKRPEGFTEKAWGKELEKIAHDFEREVEHGTYLDGNKLTFAEFTDKWLHDYAEKQLQPKTIYYYKDMLYSRIIPCIGHLKLAKLQPTHLIEFYNNLAEKGIRRDYKYRAKPELISLIKEKGIARFSREMSVCNKTISNLARGGNTLKKITNIICKELGIKSELLFEAVGDEQTLTANSIMHYHRLISSMLTIAVQWQLVVSNISSRVRPPKVERHEAEHYDEDQVELMLSLLEKEHIKVKTVVHLVLFGGMRLGELAGLTWSDIGYEDKQLTIKQAGQYLPGIGVYTKNPKNESSVREISIPEMLTDLLSKYKAWQNEERLKCGDLWEDHDRIFTKWNGEPIFPDTPSKWFRKFREKNNLPKLTFHQLRHTNASLLIGQGIDVATVSKRLGHASISTTQKIYTHALKRPDREASDKLEKLFKKDSKEITKQG
jgi:integrase